eukprot:1912_1
MLTRCTNPYDAIIGGKEFIGSDGMNIADLKRYVSKQNGSISTATDEDIDEDDVDENGNIVGPSAPLNKSSDGNALRPLTSVEALELALKFNHIAPTGPDSLPTFPFKDKDPFIFETTPHVFFAGNCNEYESKIVEQKNSDESKKTALLCVPSFCTHWTSGYDEFEVFEMYNRRIWRFTEASFGCWRRGTDERVES